MWQQGPRASPTAGPRIRNQICGLLCEQPAWAPQPIPRCPRFCCWRHSCPISVLQVLMTASSQSWLLHNLSLRLQLRLLLMCPQASLLLWMGRQETSLIKQWVGLMLSLCSAAMRASQQAGTYCWPGNQRPDPFQYFWPIVVTRGWSNGHCTSRIHQAWKPASYSETAGQQQDSQLTNSCSSLRNVHRTLALIQCCPSTRRP
jgi:hypothetical protein